MRGIDGRTRQRKSMGRSNLSVLLVILLFGSMVPFTADADTVIRSEDVDLFPLGSFDDASEWTVWSNKAYSEEVAEYSTSMIACLLYTSPSPRD